MPETNSVLHNSVFQSKDLVQFKLWREEGHLSSPVHVRYNQIIQEVYILLEVKEIFPGWLILGML
jgi:hypothetical protein